MTLDFAEVKPTVLNALVILAIVMVMVPAARWALGRWYIPGLTELINAV